MTVNRVYILGAGFSAALGGPLFSQLLTREFDYSVRDCIGDNRDYLGKMLFEVPQFLSEMEAAKTAQKDAKQPIKNAELTLEFYSDMAFSGTGKFLDQVAIGLKRFYSNPHIFENDAQRRTLVAVLCKMIKSHLAISTSDFVCRLPKENERWEPYVSWFSTLTERDTIVTFNYDPVIETLAERCQRPYFAENSTSVEQYVSCPTGNPKLFKLHGSADWYVNLEAKNLSHIQYHKLDTRHYCEHLLSVEKECLIGVPGIGKKSLKDGILKLLWDDAYSAISNAEHVSIIGYSMPATDNVARWMILSALRNNVVGRQVDLVLGPDITAVTRRLEAILKPMLGTSLQNTGMYAQDYLERLVMQSQSN